MSAGMGNGRSWESTLGLGISGRACARGAPAADLFPSEVLQGPVPGLLVLWRRPAGSQWGAPVVPWGFISPQSQPQCVAHTCEGCPARDSGSAPL